MGRLIPVRITSRLELPADIPIGLRRALRSHFTHSNPEFYKKLNLGYQTYGTDRRFKAYIEPDGTTGPITIPRGGLEKLIAVFAEEGFKPRFFNGTHRPSPVDYPRFCIDPDDLSKVLRPYQVDAIQAALKHKQGIIRAPTGSGKTTVAFGLIYESKQRAIVMVNDGNLAEQWIREASRSLGIPEKEIGLVRGGRKYRPGEKLTIALVQSLYRKGNKLSELLDAEQFGMVLFDEVQRAAARTFVEVIDKFPSEYRIGLSADETRKDKKEFLVYDQFGKVIYEIERSTLEAKKYIHPVNVRMIPTDFRADWYRDSAPADRDWGLLLEQMTGDEHRHARVMQTLEIARNGGELPAIIFSHRREYADVIAESVFALGIPCGLMMGGNAKDRALFDEARDRIVAGELDVAVGTFHALGTGINMPAICAGICTTPIGNNRQYFGQVRGRTCRLAEGKTRATMYYLWDRHVFPDTVARFMKWNDNRVEVLDGDTWRPGSDF